MRKIFLIDNYDSFTYNLLYYLEELGCEVTVKRNDKFELDEIINYDAILISPGPGIPEEAGKIIDVIKMYFDTKNIFGFVNTTWVFSKVSKKIDYSILMHEIENVGYKRSKRGEKIMPNDLYRTNQHGEIIVNDGKKIKALDFLREINWD